MKQSPHTIRFSDPNESASKHSRRPRGLAPAEFVRFATLAAIADEGASVARLAPLIKSTFRGTVLLASRIRAEMLDAGEQEDLDVLIATARNLQDELLGGASE